MSVFNYEKDADGIVTITMDMSGPVNAMNEEYRQAMAETINKLEQEDGIAGVIFASAKKTFFAGGDLNELLAAEKGQEAEFMAMLDSTKGNLRRLEKLPVPVVAAIDSIKFPDQPDFPFKPHAEAVVNFVFNQIDHRSNG